MFVDSYMMSSYTYILTQSHIESIFKSSTLYACMLEYHEYPFDYDTDTIGYGVCARGCLPKYVYNLCCMQLFVYNRSCCLLYMLHKFMVNTAN